MIYREKLSCILEATCYKFKLVVSYTIFMLIRQQAITWTYLVTKIYDDKWCCSAVLDLSATYIFQFLWR